MTVTYKKKLIEVALPLDAINKASAQEKLIRQGHPSTLHIWWSRKPLSTCRAVLFASLVDDPSSREDRFPTKSAQDEERQRLFGIIEKLVVWENSNDKAVLDSARKAILDSTGGKLPPVFDPFCGGGSIPLEAARLGLKACASDLNPVAVLITKALIEIPPKFAGHGPVNPAAREDKGLVARVWSGAQGLAEDVRYYGKWMRAEADRRIGRLYPKVKLPREHGGGEATVIAWLWGRTVKCPNPACGGMVTLTNKWHLSVKKGKEAHIEPVVSGRTYTFKVKSGGTVEEGTVNRRGARCLCCGLPVPFDHVRAEGKAGRMSAKLMAIVAEGRRGRIYLSPSLEDEELAASAMPPWEPEGALPKNPRDFKTPNYGMTVFRDLFTSRQLVALTCFSDLVAAAREEVLRDAHGSGMADDARTLESGGKGGQAYADAVATYLALALSRLTVSGCNLVTWNPTGEKAQRALGRQMLPMIWDFAETNPLGSATGSWDAAIELECDPLRYLGFSTEGHSDQCDAVKLTVTDHGKGLISTDPPYYDNIGYADLSDFFYAWLRPTLKDVYPNLLRTIQVPKSGELVVTPYRFDGDKEKARDFFEAGLERAFACMQSAQDPEYPLTVYYAFKQAETEDDGDKSGGETHASTGWETMLGGLIKAGFSVHGTWPMRTELTNWMKAKMNALASSIVLVCRVRQVDAPAISRGEFMRVLKRDLPTALRNLQRGNIAPVDLAQAAIGPGMAIFTSYATVLDATGAALTVRDALALINQALDEVLTEQEGDFDADTRWALAWFEQYGFNEGPFGVAETLSKAKVTSVPGMVEAGILVSRTGKVRLLGADELPVDWDPAKDKRLTAWECLHQLVRALTDGGETAAAALAGKLGAEAEVARELAYRLYVVCERKKRAAEALSYNALVQSWPEITRLAREGGKSRTKQADLFDQE